MDPTIGGAVFVFLTIGNRDRGRKKGGGRPAAALKGRRTRIGAADGAFEVGGVEEEEEEQDDDDMFASLRALVRSRDPPVPGPSRDPRSSSDRGDAGRIPPVLGAGAINDAGPGGALSPLLVRERPGGGLVSLSVGPAAPGCAWGISPSGVHLARCDNGASRVVAWSAGSPTPRAAPLPPLPPPSSGGGPLRALRIVVGDDGSVVAVASREEEDARGAGSGRIARLVSAGLPGEAPFGEWAELAPSGRVSLGLGGRHAWIDGARARDWETGISVVVRGRPHPVRCARPAAGARAPRPHLLAATSPAGAWALLVRPSYPGEPGGGLRFRPLRRLGGLFVPSSASELADPRPFLGGRVALRADPPAPLAARDEAAELLLGEAWDASVGDGGSWELDVGVRIGIRPAPRWEPGTAAGGGLALEARAFSGRRVHPGAVPAAAFRGSEWRLRSAAAAAGAGALRAEGPGGAGVVVSFPGARERPHEVLHATERTGCTLELALRARWSGTGSAVGRVELLAPPAAREPRGGLVWDVIPGTPHVSFFRRLESAPAA